MKLSRLRSADQSIRKKTPAKHIYYPSLGVFRNYRTVSASCRRGDPLLKAIIWVGAKKETSYDTSCI